MRTTLAILAGCLIISGCSDDSTGSDPECGDGVIEGDEQCDGADLNDQTCVTLGYTGGTLACSLACRFDTMGCQQPPGCGNDQIDPNEDCDGNDLNNQTCQSLGFPGGTLACSSICTYNTLACDPPVTCGDGSIQPPEQCDGTNLNGQTCVSLGFDGGTLICVDCSLDLSQCFHQPDCGNGTREAGEECDGSDLGGQTCEGLGYPGGTLGCTGGCEYDETNCDPIVTCGNGVKDPNEPCEGMDFGGQTCVGLGYDGGTLACTAGCIFDTSGCHECGNGFIEGAELCDGSDLGGNDCTTIGMGFTGGTLACSGTCDGWNTSGCTGGTTSWEIRSTEMRLMFSSFSLIAAHPTHPTTIAVCPAADDIFPFFEVYRSTDGFNFARRAIYSFTPSVGFYSDPIALAYDPNDGNNLVAATWPMPPPSIDLAIIHAWSSNGGGFFDHSQWMFTNPWPADDMRFPGGAQSEVVWRANSFFHYSLSLGEWNDHVETLNVPAGCNMVMGFDMPWDNHDSVGVWCQNGAAFVCPALTGPCLAVPIPGGGAVDYLTFAPSNPSYMYILAQGPGGDAVFVSNDRGVTVTETLSLNGRVVKVHPANHLTACVFALQGSELHCTTDGGNTWQDLTPPDLDPPDSTNIHDFTFSSDGAIWATAYPGVIRHPPL